MKKFYELLVSNMIFFLILIVLIVMVTGCAKTIKEHTSKTSNGPTDFQAIADVLGCMFAPETCPKENNNDQEEITKELDELDNETK